MIFNIILKNVFAENLEKNVWYKKSDETDWLPLKPTEESPKITLEPGEYLEIYAKDNKGQIGCAIQFKSTSILFSNLCSQHTTPNSIPEWAITNSSTTEEGETGGGDINISIGDDNQ